MTLHHLTRTALVAGIATAVLAMATGARAGEGDTSFEARTGMLAQEALEPQASPSLRAAPLLAGREPSRREARRARQVRSGDVDATGSVEGPAAASRGGSYSALIARHAAANGVPYAIADAMVRIESRYNPGARNGPNVGLTQINPRTARGLGFQGSTAALYDPDTNLRYGIKYLAQAYRLAGGDLCGTVLRYQAGHGARSMTGAARVYCSKARAIMASR